jgi:hypothetical protein
VSAPGDGVAAALSALRRFAAPRRADAETCELCGAALAHAHEHLIDPPSRRLACACGACAVLFTGGAKWKRVRRHVERLDLALDDATWRALRIPIRLAFFTVTSEGVRAAYPSPAGATEAELPAGAWAALTAAHPALASLEPDVEALLVDRAPAGTRAFRISIDECYRLVGLLRMHWRGFGGGAEAWARLERFFAELQGGAPCPS